MRRAFASVIALCAVFAVAGADAAGRADARGALAEALRHERAGDLRAARVEALNAARDDPRWAAPAIVQARIAIALRDGLGAKAALAKAHAAGADDGQIVLFAAHAAMLTGDPDGALATLARAPAGTGRPGYAERLAGMARAARGETQAARDAYAQSAQIAPDNAPLWIDVARLALGDADPLGAERAIDRALALDGAAGEALQVKAVIVRDRYGPMAALPWFDRAVGADAANRDAWLGYAAALGDTGRYRDMLSAVRRAAAIDPSDKRPLFLQAVLAARARRYELARGLLDRTGGALDGQPSYMLVRAAVEARLGSYGSALDWASRLLALQPGNERARALFVDASLASGDAVGAWAAVLPAVERQPATSWYLIQAAHVLAALGRGSEAYTLYDQARAMRAIGGAVPVGDASVGGAAGEGIAAVRAAVRGGGDARDTAAGLARIAGGVADAHILLGDARTTAGDGRGAAAAYRAAIGIRASEAAATRLIAALLRVGDRRGAASALSAYLAYAPRSIAGARLAAEFYIDAHDWSNAIATLSALRARLGERDALILAQLGRCRLEIGEFAAARDDLATAYALQPGNADLSSLYAIAIARSGGDRRAARDLAVKAVAIEPGNREFRRRLDAVTRQGA